MKQKKRLKDRLPPWLLHKLRLLRRPSLKKKLIFLIVVGYFVPVLLIIAMLRDFVTQQYDQQVLDKVELSLTETTELASNYLLSMLEASWRSSYDGEVEQAYRRYLTNQSEEDLYVWTHTALQRTYRFDSLFFTVGLFYQDPELEPIYLINEGAPQQKIVPLVYQGLEEEIRQIAQGLGSKNYFYNHNNNLYMIRNLLDSEYKKYGILVLEVNVERMFGAFQGITGVTQVDIHFDNAVISSQIFAEGVEIITLQHSLEVENHQMAVSLWVDVKQGQDSLEDFQNEITQVLILIIPAIAYMLYAFYLHITRPLQVLNDAQSKVAQGELGYQVTKITDSVEIRTITRGFNAMSRSMKEQFEQSYQEQLALQDARMKTLQSQINPHFLNNTLEIINWETRIAGNDNASAMIESLSVMLRATMDREGKGKIPFRQELTYVDAYLYIQSCRMGKRLEIQRNISEETLDMLVPRLAFQPIVENACEHGIARQKNGVIVVSSYLSEHNLVLEVKNSGHMSEENQQRIANLLEWNESSQTYATDSPSLGVRNVNQRVKLMYGQEFGLDMFNDTLEEMTIAELALPIELEAKE